MLPAGVSNLPDEVDGLPPRAHNAPDDAPHLGMNQALRSVRRDTAAARCIAHDCPGRVNLVVYALPSMRHGLHVPWANSPGKLLMLSSRTAPELVFQLELHATYCETSHRLSRFLNKALVQPHIADLLAENCGCKKGGGAEEILSQWNFSGQRNWKPAFAGLQAFGSGESAKHRLTGGEWGIRTPDRAFDPITV